MDKTRMDKQYDFLREIDKEKSIFRHTYLADGSRKENDSDSLSDLPCVIQYGRRNE